MASHKTVTSEDVRIFLNDFPATNRLHKKIEFSAERIQKAVKFIIDEWNTTPPVGRVYTDEDFPYKSTLLYGVVAWLFMGEATFQERNHLSYQSGGLSINDDESSQAYLNFANFFDQKFKERMEMQKKAENLERGWGSVRSTYYGHESYY